MKKLQFPMKGQYKKIVLDNSPHIKGKSKRRKCTIVGEGRDKKMFRIVWDGTTTIITIPKSFLSVSKIVKQEPRVDLTVPPFTARP